jgi:hypothetical protein
MTSTTFEKLSETYSPQAKTSTTRKQMLKLLLKTFYGSSQGDTDSAAADAVNSDELLIGSRGFSAYTLVAGMDMDSMILDRIIGRVSPLVRPTSA